VKKLYSHNHRTRAPCREQYVLSKSQQYMTTAHTLSRQRSPSVGTRNSYAINIKIVSLANGPRGGIDFFGEERKSQ